MRKIQKKINIGGSVELGFFAVYTLTANILDISVVVNEINEASKFHAVAQRDTGSMGVVVFAPKVQSLEGRRLAAWSSYQALA